MKKLLLPILTFFVFTLLFTKFFVFPVSAQNIESSSYLEPNVDASVPKNLHTFTQSLFIEFFSTYTCFVIGADPISPNGKCLGVDPQTKKITYVDNNGGAVNQMGQLIGMTYNFPISSNDYATYLSHNFGFSKKAQAAEEGGIGFEGLKPIQKIWIQFRNIVYLLFSLIVVIIGLGIMFRFKLNDRAVMAVQNQIPKIIITLVLVTFSFPIAGFLIDMMWVLLLLLFATFSPLDESGALGNMLKYAFNTPFGFANHLYNLPLPFTDSELGIGFFIIPFKIALGTGEVISNVINNLGIFHNTITQTVTRIIFLIPQSVSPVYQDCVIQHIESDGGIISRVTGISLDAMWDCTEDVNVIGSVAGILGGMIMFFIVSIAIFITLVRIWFRLLTSYIRVLLAVILSPFWIAMGIIPNSGLGFGAWLKYIITYLLVFPATIFMFLIAKVLMSAFAPGEEYFTPPLIGNPGAPEALSALFGMATILITPEVINMIKDKLNTPSLKYAQAIPNSLGIGAQVVKPFAGIPKNVLFARNKEGVATGPLSTAYDERIKRPLAQRLSRSNSSSLRNWGLGLRDDLQPYTEEEIRRLPNLTDDEKRRLLNRRSSRRERSPI